MNLTESATHFENFTSIHKKLPKFFFQDPSNLEAKLQQHQAFEAELQANKWRIDGVVETGEQLTSAQHSASDTIQ